MKNNSIIILISIFCFFCVVLIGAILYIPDGLDSGGDLIMSVPSSTFEILTTPTVRPVQTQPIKMPSPTAVPTNTLTPTLIQTATPTTTPVRTPIKTVAPTPTPTETPKRPSGIPMDVAVGSSVTFGAYEQDANQSNGKEPIKWTVLDKQGDRALLIAKYVLDSAAYHPIDESVTWETCGLRNWLNSTFYNNAFSNLEQQSIVMTTVENIGNTTYKTDGGNDTQDKVFLLSTEEASLYFNNKEARRAIPTNYAIQEDVYYYRGNTTWWTRTPGDGNHRAILIDRLGTLNLSDCGSVVYNDGEGVRPVIWVYLGN